MLEELGPLVEATQKSDGQKVHHLVLAEEVSFFNKASVMQVLDSIPANSKVIIDSAALSRSGGSIRCFSGSRCRPTDTRKRWNCCWNTTPAGNIFRNSQNA